jgi:tetratricopeptide (TPR) repeat protein
MRLAFLFVATVAIAIVFGVPILRADSIKPSLQLVEGLIDAEQYEQASELLNDIAPEGRAATAQADILRGRIALAQGQSAQALALFEKASTASLDREAVADLYMGEAKLALGKVAQARLDVLTALRTDPDLAAAELVLAQVDSRNGHAKEAMARLLKLGKTHPDDDGLAIATARFRTARQGPEAGIGALQEFANAHPDSAATQDALGGLLWAAGRKVESVRARIAAGELYLTAGQTGRATAMAIWIKAVDADGSLERQARATQKEASAPLLVAPATPGPLAVPRPVAPPSNEPPPPLASPRPAVPTTELAPNQIEAVRPPEQPTPSTVPPPLATAAPNDTLANPEPLPFAPGSTYLSGSGIVLEGGRLIVTNRHVIEGMGVIYARNGTGHVRQARVVKVSREDDLALLEIESPYPEGAVVQFSDMVDPAPGRSAVVMGFPLVDLLGDDQPALTEGIVAKITGLSNDPKTFQMTTKINKGNSGGPVFDRQGRLMGITVGQTDAADIYRKSGFLVEDMNIGIKADRILHFLGRDAAAPSVRGAEMNLEDLYELMLPRVVLVAAQK